MLVYYTYIVQWPCRWSVRMCLCVVDGERTLAKTHWQTGEPFCGRFDLFFPPFSFAYEFYEKEKNIHLFRYIALTRTNQMAHAPLTRACCDLVWRAHYLIHTNGLAIASNQSTERASAAEIHHKAEQKIGMSSNQPKKNWTLTGMSITIALLCKVSWGSILWPIQRYSSCALFFCSTANMFNAQCNA